MRKSKIVYFINLLVLFSSCTKSNESECYYDSIPNSLGLRITKSGVVVSDIDLLNVRLSYFENNEKKYVSDFTINNIDSNIRNKGYISSRLIGIISANNNIKVYYLEYPNGWQTDTIYVDFLPRSIETNCQYVLNPVKVNSILATVYITPDFGGEQVYEVNKP